MSDSIDVNDMINMNRNIYGTQQSKGESKVINKPADDSSLTIDNILKVNQAFYNPVQIQASEVREEILEESEDEKPDFFHEVRSMSKTPEITSLNLIYNYKTIFKNDGIPLEEAKRLDNIRIIRKEREQKASGASINKEPVATKKQYVRLYKNQIAKLYFQEPKELVLVSKHLVNNSKWEKHLKLSDFGGVRPSLSIVQEKTTGRFYIYDNKHGKVHIYSSDMLINDNKDKPLVSLNLNEDKPRQDPLLYLVECEHEYQWKSVLFVIGGHHQQRGIKRPLRTIKVFEIKRREVTLTPVLTITMTKPRNNPIVFDLVKFKGMYWQDKEQADKEKCDPQYRSVDQKYLFVMGGNPLLEYEKEVDQELKEANQTCEYISLKLVLEHIARAKLFSQNDQGNLGLNFGKFSIPDTLTIKFQNSIVTEKIYNHFYHASIAKMVDDLFQQKVLVIVGGNTTQTLQLQAISFKMNEITFIGGTKYIQIQKPSLIYSASNLRYYQKRVHYFDDTKNTEPCIIRSMENRKPEPSCTCLIM